MNMNILRLSTDLQTSLLKALGPDSSATEMLTIIVDKAAEKLDASVCTIFTVDEGGQTATQRAGTGYQHKFVGQVSCRIVPAHQVAESPRDGEKLGLTGWIISTGKSFLARSPEELAAHPHRLGQYDSQQLPGRELRLQSFLGVPLHDLRGRIIGLIKVERREKPGGEVEPFSVTDQIVLGTMARVASKCLEYLDMARSSVEDAALAWARDVVGEAVATEGELDSFLDIVVDVTAAAMRADSCAIYLTDESKKTLTQRAGNNSLAPRAVIRSYDLPEREQIEAQKPVGMTAWIAATGEPFRAPNLDALRKHPHHRGRYDKLNFSEGKVCGAFLGVPLRIGGTIIGVLKIENTSTIGEPDPRAFSRETQRRLDILAQDIALDIKRLESQSLARYQVIDKAKMTIFEILRGGLTVPELVKKVVNATAELFNARACALFLKEGNQLIQPRWAAYGWAGKGHDVRTYTLVKPEEIRDAPAPHEKVGLTVWIAVKREKFKARSNRELKMHPHHKGTYDDVNFNPGEACESFMGVHLVTGDKLVGVLKVETKRKPAGNGMEFTYFNEQDELVFDLIANSAAIAIENARLLESQRLADQLRRQAQDLLRDLHTFAKEPWHPVDTLTRAAESLRAKAPAIATIIDSYAALLQPGLSLNTLEFFRDSIRTFPGLLEEKEPVTVLYSTFVEALGVDSLDDVSKLCSSRSTLLALQQKESQFFLTAAVKIMEDLYRNVARFLQRDGKDASGRSSLDKIVDYLNEAQAAAEQLSDPEKKIIARVIEKWREVIHATREQFQEVPNPYVAGPPIKPEEGTPFFGRQDIFDWVAENLYSATQTNALVLYGERRMGKTSILLQLDRGEQGEKLRERGNRTLHSVYVDLQPFADTGTYLFLYRIADKIGQSEALRGHVDTPALSEFEKAPYFTFDTFMERVNGAIAPALLVVMLDEFEKLEDLVKGEKVEPDIYGQLRHQMQFLSNVIFILAGTHRLKRMSLDYQLSLNTALHQKVGFMERPDAEKLIRTPVATVVTYDNEAVEAIWRLTHGHPYFIQLLCSKIISDMNNRAESNYVSAADMDRVVESVLKDLNLDHLWHESESIDQQVLVALADGTMEADRDQLTLGDLSTHLQPLNLSKEQLTDSLKRLTARGLIEATNQWTQSRSDPAYGYAFDLLRLWLLRNRLL